MSKLCLEIMTLVVCDAPARSNRNAKCQGYGKQAMRMTHRRSFTVNVFFFFFFHFGFEVALPLLVGLSHNTQTFYFPPTLSLLFLLFLIKPKGELGMLAQLFFSSVFLFVWHQLWTCTFHCPKRSLNIPLLHVLVPILAVFAIALIHTEKYILTIKLKPHCEAFQTMHKIKYSFVTKTCKMSLLAVLRPALVG